MRIEVDSVTVRVEDTTILDRIDLALGPNEIVGLIGPNGAGKSTLLKAIANLSAVSAGTIRYDGADAREVGARRLGGRGVG